MKTYHIDEITYDQVFYKTYMTYRKGELSFKTYNGLYCVNKNTISVYLQDPHDSELYTKRVVKSFKEGESGIRNYGNEYSASYTSLTDENTTEVKQLLLDKLREYADTRLAYYTELSNELKSIPVI